MALPSVVTMGSAAFVLAAGLGYVAISSASADNSAGAPASQADPGPSFVQPVKHVPAPQHSAKTTKPTVNRHPNVVPKVLVAVYNNTTITGLAQSKATILEGAGWHVAATDNWHGLIPADTVYYPDGMRPAAVKLAKVLHIDRLRPAVTPMQFDRLTVILATG